ncbi:hypothetical protein [Comamonas terrae]|uniref:Uncharacterized protein n=1 Tax=Comamonas terrae TaxID=673548 RepID=A0ABW5USR0_9BURK|nr:hypothetical protein [Comamonas terrae]
MAVEQGEYGLWYSKGVGFATREQAQAHEDRSDSLAQHTPPSADVKKLPAVWPGVIVAVVIVASLVVITMRSCSDSTSPIKKAADEAALQEIKLQRFARERLAKQLKDPDSAQFRNQKGFCGEVNAKNSFGGYIGFKRFIAGGENLIFMEDDKRLEAGAFQAAWEKFCR